MKKPVLAFVLLLLSAQVVFAQNATWVPVRIKHSWDLGMSHFCNQPEQCLVDLRGNIVFDNQTQRYFASENPKNWPKCVTDEQYLLDFYCNQGNWTTRTSLVAEQLVRLGEALSPKNYSVYCSSYDKVLNNYLYLIGGARIDEYLKEACTKGVRKVPCTNNICVLKTPQIVAFGTSLNIPVDHSQKSFLKAINRSTNLCESIAGNTFQSCGQGVWYNQGIESIIFTTAGTPSAPVSTALFAQKKQPITNYVFSSLHEPKNPDRNFTYYPKTQHFNHVFVARSDNKRVFGFLEKNIIDVAPPPLDYLGVQYENISLGSNPCVNIIKQYDDKAFCENQTGPGFIVVARHRPGLGASPLVQAWPDLTGKLRLQ